MIERSHVKKIVNAILFSILIIVYYLFYMEKAVENYRKSSTTIVQRQEEIYDPKSPVFVICPDPPFKTSFFRDLGVSNAKAADKYFWVHSMFWDVFENNSFNAMEAYMNMSYKLELDWNIFLYHFIPE